MIDSPLIMEEVAEPDRIARARAHDQRLKQNLDWLNARWADLLPRRSENTWSLRDRKPSSPTRTRKPWPWPRPRTPTMTARSASTFSLIEGGSRRYSKVMRLRPSFATDRTPENPLAH